MMAMYVRCAHCRTIYDLFSVEVTQRYADCSVWYAPCCGRQVSDSPMSHDYDDYLSEPKDECGYYDNQGRYYQVRYAPGHSPSEISEKSSNKGLTPNPIHD